MQPPATTMATDNEAGRFPLRARLLLTLAVLLPLNAYWVILSETVRYAGHPTTTSLYYNCIFWLCLLLPVNALLRRFAPKAAFHRGELLLIYFSLQMTSALSGHDMAEVLLPILSHAHQHADAANNWAEILLPHLPRWLVVTDRAALDAFYTGHDSLYRPQNWQAWIVPLGFWCAFFGVLCAVMLAMNVLLRRQWTERERLPFPILTIPLEITRPDTPLFRSPLLWIGFALAVLLQFWNGLAFLYPSVPMLPIKVTDYRFFSDRPWSAVGTVPIGFYPFGIALGMFLPVDFLFSSWFFFWFWKGQAVVSAAMAWDRTPNFPYVTAQSLGGYLGVSLTALYLGRHHLKTIFGYLWGDHPASPDDADSPISYRAAAAVILIGMILLSAFCRFAGMSPFYIAAFWVIYLAIALAVTRMRGELGPPVHDLHMGGPDTILPQVMGPTSVDRQTLTLFGLFYGFNRAYRGHPMPIQLEALASASRGGFGREQRSFSRVLFGLMLVLGFVGPALAFWAILHLCYVHGAESAIIGPPNVFTIFGSEPWNRFRSQVRVPQPPQTGATIAIGVGTAFALLLNFLRMRIVGFPFHPVGYAVASSWGMGILWMPMLIAWVLKVLILRYGGLPLFRALLPLFYGVILGECVAGSLWTLLSMASGIPMYGFWP
ncbi:MAG: DUF6785 family protein [Capsulimonadales bacterium]|nr:DUF6785 family protein [Capsulimonadales bacterium]